MKGSLKDVSPGQRSQTAHVGLLCDVTKVLDLWLKPPVPFVLLEQLMLVEHTTGPISSIQRPAIMKTYPE